MPFDVTSQPQFSIFSAGFLDRHDLRLAQHLRKVALPQRQRVGGCNQQRGSMLDNFWDCQVIPIIDNHSPPTWTFWPFVDDSPTPNHHFQGHVQNRTIVSDSCGTFWWYTASTISAATKGLWVDQPGFRPRRPKSILCHISFNPSIHTRKDIDIRISIYLFSHPSIQPCIPTTINYTSFHLYIHRAIQLSISLSIYLHIYIEIKGERASERESEREKKERKKEREKERKKERKERKKEREKQAERIYSLQFCFPMNPKIGSTMIIHDPYSDKSQNLRNDRVLGRVVHHTRPWRARRQRVDEPFLCFSCCGAKRLQWPSHPRYCDLFPPYQLPSGKLT